MKNLKNKIAMVGAVALIGASSLVSGCAATRERGIRWVDPLTTLTDTIRYVNGGDMSKEQQDAVGENGNLATFGLDVMRYTRGGDMIDVNNNDSRRRKVEKEYPTNELIIKRNVESPTLMPSQNENKYVSFDSNGYVGNVTFRIKDNAGKIVQQTDSNFYKNGEFHLRKDERIKDILSSGVYVFSATLENGDTLETPFIVE